MTTDMLCVRLLLLIGLSATPVPTVSAQADQSNSNLHSTPEDVKVGQRLVRRMCTVCHGIDGTGGRGPDLTAETLRHGNSPREVYRNIQMGIPDTGMKGIRLPSKLVWQMVSYLRQSPEKVLDELLPGDPAKGKQLFEKHQCASCHWTDSTRGRRGNDLRKASSTLEYVRRSIVDPNADLDDQYPKVVLVLADGRVLSGLLLNENGYYVQFIDGQENLRTVAKEDVEELRRPDESLMPSYRDQLTSDELVDLINYVFSLRKP